MFIAWADYNPGTRPEIRETYRGCIIYVWRCGSMLRACVRKGRHVIHAFSDPGYSDTSVNDMRQSARAFIDRGWYDYRGGYPVFVKP